MTISTEEFQMRERVRKAHPRWDWKSVRREARRLLDEHRQSAETQKLEREQER